MANSLGAIFIDDPLMVPKTLVAVNRLWSALPMIQIPQDARIIFIKLFFDRSDPPREFADEYSGHNSFGFKFIPGVEGTGITGCQYDTVGEGSGKTASARTRQGGIDNSRDTELDLISNGQEDLIMFNSDVILISYGILNSDFESLLATARNMEFPVAT